MELFSKKKGDESGSEYRDRLSTWISLMSIAGVLALTGIIMYWAGWVSKDPDTMKLVFAAVLPLFGAWVATILAFYYGKENFEAGSRSITKATEAFGLTKKLEEIPVTIKMIAKKDMTVDDREPKDIKLVTDILDKLSEKERLPILDKKGAVIYMIHRSYIDRYLTQRALQPQPPKLQELTLQNLFDDDSKLKDLFKESFGFVKENATLADAKTEMERISKRQDVFVTKSGNKEEPIIGWITNNIIQEIAKI